MRRLSALKYIRNGQNPDVRSAGSGAPSHWSAFWGKADEDGMPFRGPVAPLMKTAEYDQVAGISSDFHSVVLNLADPEQNRQFEQIIDKAVNTQHVTIMRCELLPPQPGYLSVMVWYTENFREVPRQQ